MDFWLKEHECTACGACQNICPKDALGLVEDARGYLYPEIQHELCIDCGACQRVCPLIHLEPEDSAAGAYEIKVYAAWSKDEETRYYSTSGGAFSELARAILRQGGTVFGAAYDENNQVVHQVARNEEELRALRQSKYTQSAIGDTFRQVKSALHQGKPVMFCGCPCQIAGLQAYLGESPDNLYLVDFICRGVMLPKVYRAWLSEQENKYGGKATQVWFKNKEQGWKRCSTRLDFASGACYKASRYDDFYMRAFLERNLGIKPACTECHFKGARRQSDIMLADFWGVAKAYDSDKGTSVIMISSAKGERLLEQAQESLELHLRSLEEVRKGNMCLDHCVKPGADTKRFFELLDAGRSFSQAFEESKQMNENPTLTVALLVLEPSENLGRCLESLHGALTEQVTLRVYASQAEAIEGVSVDTADVTVLEDASRADLINAAVADAGTDYLHLLEPDVIMDASAYQTLTQQMALCDADALTFGYRTGLGESAVEQTSECPAGTGDRAFFMDQYLGAQASYQGEDATYGNQLFNRIFKVSALRVPGTKKPRSLFGDLAGLAENAWLLACCFSWHICCALPESYCSYLGQPSREIAFPAELKLEKFTKEVLSMIEMADKISPRVLLLQKRSCELYTFRLAMEAKRRGFHKSYQGLHALLAALVGVPEESSWLLDEMVEMQAEVRNAKATVGKRAQDIEWLKNQVAARETSIVQLEKSVAARGEKIQSQSTDIEWLKNQVAARDSRISQLEKSAAARGEKIQSQSTDIEWLKNQVAARESQIVQLEKSVAARGEKIQSQSEDIAWLKKRLAAREEELASIKETTWYKMGGKINMV